MKKQATTAVVVAILLFALGVLTGALGHRFYDTRKAHARGQDDFRQHYIAELRGKLKLTPQQVTELEAIMDRTHARFRAVHDANGPVLAKIRDEHTAAVRSILTPQQAPLYDQIVAEHDRRARQADQHDH